ncbi:MAG: hypothetical protein H6862_00035 [Rhodospirillales bacterium]|nr:hypothetical protein [Rhodospirillales bacterium]
MPPILGPDGGRISPGNIVDDFADEPRHRGVNGSGKTIEQDIAEKCALGLFQEKPDERPQAIGKLIDPRPAAEGWIWAGAGTSNSGFHSGDLEGGNYRNSRFLSGQRNLP